MYFFVPKDFSLEKEYRSFIGVKDLFLKSSTGVESQKDGFCISHEAAIIRQRVSDLINNDIARVHEMYPEIKDGTAWTLAKAQNSVGKKLQESLIVPIDVFPFDQQYTYYKKGFLARTREGVLGEMLHTKQLSLVVPRQSSKDWHHVFCSNTISNGNFLASAKLLGSGTQFPLYLHTTAIDGSDVRTPNLNPAEWKKFNDAIGKVVSPLMLLCYIYGILHSPSYRERYKEFLKIDFPRIPLPIERKEFLRIGRIGHRLMNIHLMRFTDRWNLTTTFPESGDNVVDAISYQEGRVMINATQYFGNVPEEAWNAYIGGYQPAQKWLKDRRGRALSFDETNHYRCIIYALSETQRLMEELR